LSYFKSTNHLNNAAAAREIANSIKCSCQYCQKVTNKANIKRHEQFCYLNPENFKACPNCGNPIKNYKGNTTCSVGCYNSLYRSGPNNPNWKESNYATTCFHFHKKECVVCGETNIVSVHHLDENHNNNSPDNLIPMCPTHHQYWHSRFKHLVEEKVMAYIKAWKNGE
jgi:HNH endonuclease